MPNKMTIQTFSGRTGLPPSTLRYYEKEGLLFPDIRADNSYRLYRENQIPTAIKIHSLRQAGISLSEIKLFLNADEAKQIEWMAKWRKDIETKLSTLHVARQFLYGIEPRDEHIRLVKWDVPVRMLWSHHQVKRQLNPFISIMEERASLMREQGLLNTQEVFVKQEQTLENEMVGRVGFRLPGKGILPDERLYYEEIETIEPTLFVVLDCLTNDPYACFSLMLLLQSFGFEPAGPNLERYQLNEKIHYELMIPVVQKQDKV